MEKKRLLFVIESLAGGGAEKVLTTLVQYLDKDCYDVTVLAISGGGQYEDTIKKIVPYKSLLNIPKGTSVGFIFKSLYVLKHHLIYKWLPLRLVYFLFVPKNNDIEIAFVEGFTTKLLSYSTNMKARKIAWIHIDLNRFHWTRHVYSSDLEECNSYEKYNCIVTVADTVNRAFHRVFPTVNKPVLTLYNPIDSELIIEQSKEQVGFNNSGAIRLISVGRLTNQKAFDRLLRIVGKLKKGNYSIELWLLGDGHLRDELERIIQKEDIADVVTLWGFKSNPYKYMAHSDLFVCSSISEGYSTAVTEAIVLGLPVITTDCSGMAELLNNGEFGVITENSEEALYEGVKRLLDDKILLNYYKEKAKERGRMFSLSRLMRPFEKLFNSC